MLFLGNLPVNDWAEQSGWAHTFPLGALACDGGKRAWPFRELLSQVLQDASHNSTPDLPLGWKNLSRLHCGLTLILPNLVSSPFLLQPFLPIRFALPSQAHICFLENPTCDHWCQKWSKKAGSKVGVGANSLPPWLVMKNQFLVAVPGTRWEANW